MLAKLSFSVSPTEMFPDVDMLRCKEVNNFATECILPRRPKRHLSPLPEDKECSSVELRKCCSKVTYKRRKNRRGLRLPALPEHDEC